MQAEIRVGPLAASDGAINPARGGKTGEVIVNDAGLGRYFEAASRGLLFMAANTAVQAVSLASATATGLILTNPLGSGKNLVVLNAQAAIAAAVTAVADVALFAGQYSATAVTHTTAITPRNGLIGGPVGVGLVDSSATLPASPILIRPLLGWHWVTGGTPTAGLFVNDEIAGQIIVTPGTTLSIQGLTVAHTILGGLVWVEIPA